jgi:hypothetical protein
MQERQRIDVKDTSEKRPRPARPARHDALTLPSPRRYDPARMRGSLHVATVYVLTVLVAGVSCGSSASTSPSRSAASSPEVAPLPLGGGPLKPGKYSSRAFHPVVTFEVGPGWRVDHDTTTHVDLSKSDTQHVGFAEPPPVASPRALLEQIATRLRGRGQHPSAIASATVASLSGVQVEVTVRNLRPTALVANCAQNEIRAFDLLENGEAVSFCLQIGERTRFYALDVAGATILALIDASSDRAFDGFEQDAEAVLSSARFRS